MQNKYIIGVDGGTQSTKVVIFDSSGTIVARATQQLRPLHMPANGIAEHPDDDLWDSVKAAGRKAMEQFPYDKADIVGIGLCTIRCCLVLLKEDGTLAEQAISWMDQRPSHRYTHSNPDVRYLTTTSGYTTYRLTGKMKDTAANQENPLWPFDKDTWDWIEDDTRFAEYGLSRDMLFDLELPGAVLGRVTEQAARETGFPAGLPVVATANDKAVEALGAGLSLNSNKGLISLGTYITSMVYGEENKTDPQNYFSNLACIPHQYLYESAGIRGGMSTVSWVKGIAGAEVSQKAAALGISPEDYLSREAERIPAGCYGLMTVLDWFPVPWATHRRGIMIGFEGRHTTAAHMFRSVLEGIAMTMKNKMSAMLDEIAMDPDQVVVSGGGSNSDVFMQIFADVLGVPAVRNEIKSSAGLGSAISAAVALGVYPDYETAIENMVKTEDRFEPVKKNHELYTRVNEEVYTEIPSHTDEVLRKSHEIFKDH